MTDCPPARRTLPNGATYVHANPAGNPELREQLMRRLTDDRWLLSRWFRRRTKNGSTSS